MLLIFFAIILRTQTFVLPTYSTILFLLHSLLHVSALNLDHFWELRAFSKFTAHFAISVYVLCAFYRASYDS